MKKNESAYNYYFREIVQKADPILQSQSFENVNFRFTRHLKANSVQRQATLKSVLDNPEFYIKSIAFLNFMI